MKEARKAGAGYLPLEQTMNPIETARELGIDLSLIDESLALTPEQRAVQHQKALDTKTQRGQIY